MSGLLQVKDVRAGYGRADVLWDISLEVARNQIVALIGPNGAGKSTLLRALSGMIPVRGGTVEFQGQRLDGLSIEAIAHRGLAHVPESRRLFAGLTVRENLLLGGWRHRDPHIDPVLELFPLLRTRLDHIAGSLSGGEQQMCAIARGLMSRPALIMIDELSLGLAPNVVEELLLRLPDVTAAGTSILLVEQDVDTALAVSEYAYVLENGQMAMHGTSGRLLANSEIRAAYLGVG